jgi:signal peptide peptidase SppA
VPKNTVVFIDQYLASRPWAMSRTGLDGLRAEAIERSRMGVRLATSPGQEVEGARSMRVRDGVAYIPVEGCLAYRLSWFWDYIGGRSSYEAIAQDFQRALDDPQVRAIVFEIRSHGGEAHGNSELSTLIFKARGAKPIISYVAGCCCSAAYYIASAADEIVVTPEAELGSIGTVLTYVDTTGMEEELGIKVVEIVSKQTPKKRLRATTAAGKAQLQELADAYTEVMLDEVGRNRGLAPEDVADQYGQGKTFVGRYAVEAGLADRIATQEELHAELVERTSTGPRPQVRTVYGRQSQSRSTTMNDNDTQREIESLVSAAPPAQRAGLVAGFRAMLAGIGIGSGAPDSGRSGVDSAPPAAPSTPAPSPDVAALRDTIAGLQTRIDRMEAERSRATAASDVERAQQAGDAFYMELFTAGRVLPAQRDAIVDAYASAMLDDQARPLAARVDGEAAPTRTARLRELYEGAPAVTDALMTERVATATVLPSAQPGEGATTPPAGKAPAPVSNVVRMLSATANGRKALDARERRGAGGAA